jgi:hypothetical protein
VDAPYYIIICGLSGRVIFFHNMFKRHDVLKIARAQKLCVLIFRYNVSLKIFLFNKS